MQHKTEQKQLYINPMTEVKLISTQEKTTNNSKHKVVQGKARRSAENCLFYIYIRHFRHKSIVCAMSQLILIG